MGSTPAAPWPAGLPRGPRLPRQSSSSGFTHLGHDTPHLVPRFHLYHDECRKSAVVEGGMRNAVEFNSLGTRRPECPGRPCASVRAARGLVPVPEFPPRGRDAKCCVHDRGWPGAAPAEEMFGRRDFCQRHRPAAPGRQHGAFGRGGATRRDALFHTHLRHGSEYQGANLRVVLPEHSPGVHPAG